MANEIFGEARASSTDPDDWGRAIVAAMADLAARRDGPRDAHPELSESLIANDITLHVTRDGDGVLIRATWAAAAPQD
jgi:hypothetical protein